MNVRVGIVPCVLVVVLSGTVLAAPAREYEINDENSAIGFKILNRGVNYIYGRFNRFSGTMAVDNRKDPKQLAVEVTVKTKGLDTNSKKRDKHLKGGDFFNAKKFKTIAFKSTKSTKLEDGKFELTGDLTLLSETKPITVVFEITGSKKMGPGHYLIGGHTSFTIKRSEWGMNKFLKGMADEVTITVSIEASREIPPAG